MTMLADRALIRLSPQEPGEDARGFLQGLVTNDVVKGPLPAYAALLSPQGKALFDFIVWADGEDLLIDAEAEVAPALARRLALYRLRRKIAIVVDDTLAVHWSPTEVAGAVPDPRLPALGWRWLAPADAAPVDEAWRQHRLAAGVAEGLGELGNGETLWLEANAVELNGVSFTKGCYVGQENTARMNWRQKVNRRLVVVPLERSRPERRRAEYESLGLAVDHLRVVDIPADLRPAWMDSADEEVAGD